MLFKILFLGEHTNHDLGNKYAIDPLTSSVVLLSDGVSHVLLDTGSLAWQDKLIAGLAENGLSPDDITHVLLTHFHLDHTANCVLFKNAEIHANRSYIDHKTGRAEIYKDLKQKPLPLGITIEPTPGHTEDHVSYFFEIEGLRYCMAGDAVRKDLLKDPPHYMEQERKNTFMKSVELIFSNSDIIIPGHFEVIYNNR
jgi:glyoxylase-like metal-dependent hydrolase (beta-lactamase superfamily II)